MMQNYRAQQVCHCTSLVGRPALNAPTREFFRQINAVTRVLEKLVYFDAVLQRFGYNFDFLLRIAKH